MNDTPTPRTDELGHKCAETAYNPQGDCDLLWPFTRQLERELTAVTEQRDRLAEALRGVLHGTGCCQSDKPESHPLAKYKNALIALQSLNEH